MPKAGQPSAGWPQECRATPKVTGLRGEGSGLPCEQHLAGWALPSSCSCRSPDPGLHGWFPKPTGEIQSPRKFFSLECPEEKRKGKGKNMKEFHGNISLGFCKIFSHPHMEPKTQARTESDDIAPLTYCSDMQIPSLPLKTESTSTFKANFGFIVHVARWSTAAQHSWLAQAPADTVPGSSRPLHPRVLGASVGKTLYFGVQ